jgi:hypothetical protein
MSLRERFALHGRSTVDLSRETVKDTPPLAETPPVVQDEATARGAARSGAGRSGPAERLVVAPELRARGTAYGHGVYRLFVRGRAPREPFELPRASGVDISSARGTRVEVTAPIARAISEPPSPLPAPRLAPELPPTAAAPDLLALGPDLGGYLRRVVHWPHALVARPALLGGALARLELPGLDACQAMLPRLLARPIASIHPPLVFLDVETTALDRGAGALAFMIGLAVFVDGGLQIEQWILTRLSCEAAMLTDVLARLTALAGEGAVLGSFNGASFDLPLLRTRMRRAGRCVAALERPHLDLLPPARRMWRGHGSDCRLVTLERTQLGVRRVHDIEGHEIPAVFWAWLRRPDDPEVRAVMRRVADHNLADLVTLPALAAALYARITAPPDLDTAIRAAEHHLAAGRRGEALALLERWQAAAIRPGAPPAQRRRALLLIAELLRRDPGSRARAAQIWVEVCRISPGDPAAHEALAKHLEHHAGDLAAALEVTRSSSAPCPRRLVRLQRKLIARLPLAAAPHV